MSLVHAALGEFTYLRIKAVLQKMQKELDSELTLLINRTGQQIVCEGPAEDFDLTSLSSLAAASLAATDGLAQIVGEKEFSVLFQQGRRRSIHISSLDDHYCLVLLFGERVAPGLVRWKVKKSAGALTQMLQESCHGSDTKGDTADSSDSSVYFTDEEIEKLFGQ